MPLYQADLSAGSLLPTETSIVAGLIRKRDNKHREQLQKQHLEVLHFDEKLRHYADQRITLDDGVKVN